MAASVASAAMSRTRSRLAPVAGAHQAAYSDKTPVMFSACGAKVPAGVPATEGPNGRFLLLLTPARRSAGGSAALSPRMPPVVL
jgi:hypothetical protein